MFHVLALIAATVSTVALLVVMSLTVFVVSLAFRANNTPGSRKDTADLQSAMVADFRANRPRTRLARDPGAGGDRSA